MNQIKNYQDTIYFKKSEFITFCFEIKTKEDAFEKITKIKSKFTDARHIAYAYILDQNTYKYSDDGEPSKTAGWPLLSILIKAKFVYSLVIVVRYFGGIKLGANNLIRYYPKTLKNIIKNNLYTEYIKIQKYKLVINLKKYNLIFKKIQKYDFQVEFKELNVILTLNLNAQEKEEIKTILNLDLNNIKTLM